MRRKKEDEPTAVQTSMPFQKVTVTDALYIIDNYLEDADKLPVRLREIQEKLSKLDGNLEVTVDGPLKFYSTFVVNIKL